MAFPSLLSDHEQRAFSEFLNQLAQEDTSNQPKPDGSNGPGVDPTLTLQQQQQLQLQLQHHLHLRQLQQQHQQQQQQQQQSHSGVSGPSRLSASSMMPAGVSLDGGAQQLVAQQQRDWIQQISSNPLLAPGGIINPHTMSQAMLQNPLLMAQANAISQAMVLAQQQQQQQFQLQLQQQQHQQHFQQQQQHQLQHQQQQQQQQHDSSPHSLHSMQQQYQQQSNIMPPPPFHKQHQQQQSSQYPSHQQQHPTQQESLSPNSDPGVQKPTKPAAKRKSKSDANAPGSAGIENSGGANPSRPSSPPLSHGVANGHHSPTDAVTANGNLSQVAKQESDTENAPNAPPSKKAARRKGSSARSLSMDSSSSGLVVKSPHRTNRDGYDPLQGNVRRKTKGDSGTKNGGSSQQQNGHEEKIEEYMREEGSPSPPIQQQQESTRSPTPSQSSATSQARASKKPQHELLTEAEKKANHIASEQKRRQNIRVGFDSLVEIVPTLSDCHRSEAVILQKSVDYIHRLLNQKDELKSRVRELQVHLGDPLDDVDSASDMEVEQDD